MTSPAIDLLNNLNDDQREAVKYVEGPLLIIAGPGSGKTRVITRRVAYLVLHKDVNPWNIAAVTFTNRAAREMQQRLFGRSVRDSAAPLLQYRNAERTMRTFHSLCAMVLRSDGEAIGIPKEFVIMDDDDQIGLVKQAMELVDVDPKRYPPRAVLSAISAAKSQLLGPQGLAGATGQYDQIVHRVFVQYQAALERSHAVDFDDLLRRTVDLFRESPQTLSKYQERFFYLMVDEFQDTNVAQYEIARQLAGKYQNLAVVGDPDQSIYSWRNADIRNILSFQEDYPDAKKVYLSQNYRSTGVILEAARSLIAANKHRIEQDLFTRNDPGAPVTVAEAYDEDEEAERVIEEVDRLRHEDFRLRDCVVTYRVNAQSRALEEACLRYGVSYKIVGGIRFYHRREIKDLLAYLRLVQDPYDEVSLARVINVPARGIGKRTMDDLTAWARSLDLPMYRALQTLAGDGAEALTSDGAGPFGARQRQQLVGFLGLVNDLRESAETLDLPDLIDEIMQRSGYRTSLMNLEDTDAEDRFDNIREFRGVAAGYAGRPASETLQAFIESAALVQDQDSLTEDEQDYLTLITLHQIKGLEYSAVFITGMEEGLLPHVRSLDDPSQLEEERRLAYVGMTRARKRLYLLRSFRRRFRGNAQGYLPSRFLQEIPLRLTATPHRGGGRFGDRSGGREKGLSVLDRAAAAAVAAGETGDAAPAAPPPYRAGDKVTHERFGKGIVVSCVPKPGDFEVTVAFVGDSGVKRLLHSFAKLERAEQGAQ